MLILLGDGFHGIIIPPATYNIDVNMENDFSFLPPLIIWNPLLTHPSIVNSQIQYCMTCKEEICSTSYNDGSSPSKQPRKLHSMEDIVLLVSAVYICKKGHKLIAHDERILKSFPSPIMIPFKLLHKTGFTRDFAENLFLFCRRGLNFYEIESIILERRWEHFSQQMYLLTLQHKADLGDCTQLVSKLSDKFRKEHISPSDNIISKCFLSSFLEVESSYLCNLHSLEVSESISFDHTFKVATNIGHLRPDGIWVPQYDSLFLVLNSQGSVLTWQLTKGTSFSKITRLLQDLNDRAAAQKRKVKYVYVDDCCKLRKAIQNVFGAETTVKLDLFHAVQRITKAMSKKHPQFHNCIRDLRLVFRRDGDVSHERQTHTASKETISSKLASFRERWKGTTDGFGNHILTSSSMEAINNLDKHVKSGCLSDIPPGMGTNRNERFHRHLKSLMDRTRIGILLAYALLTVLIHAHNNSENLASKKFVATNAFVTCSCSGKGHAPVGIYPQAADQVNHRDTFVNANQWGKDNSIEEVPSLEFYKNGIAKLALTKSLEFMKLNQLSKQLHLFKLLTADEPKLSQPPNIVTNDVEKKLIASGLTVEQVAPDGNCFFSSVAVGILHSVTSWSNCLKKVGFKEEEGLSGLVRCLRNAFVRELLENSSKYQPFFVDGVMENYNAEAKKFLQDGFFVGALGDLMPTAMAAVLQAPVIVFSSELSKEALYFTSPDIITSKASIFVLYQAQLSHYDAVVKVYNTSPSSGSPNKSLQVHCSCGINKKDDTKSCCPSPIYSSRCKCFNLSQPCNSLCRCKNCNNSNGKRPPSKKTMKRNRQPHSSQMELPTPKRFAQERGQPLNEGVWSDFEAIILWEIYSIHKDSFENVTRIYNKLVMYSKSPVCTEQLPKTVVFREKNSSQVQSKLKLFK